MGDINIAVNPRLTEKLGASLLGFKDYLSRLTFDMVKQEAALTARQFMKYTPPIPYKGGDSDTKAGERQGKIAVERDIRSMICPRDYNLAAAVDSVVGSMSSFEKWRSKRLHGKVGYIINKIHDDNDIPRAYQKAKNLFSKRPISDRMISGQRLRNVHDEQRRKYKGRITRNRGPEHKIKQDPYFAEATDLDSYIEKRQDMVGKINAGWWSTIQKIGKVRIRGLDVTPASKGVPKYITKHNINGYILPLRASGAVRFDSITVINPIGDVNGVGTEANVKARAIAFRMKAIAARPYDKIIRRNIDDFNSGKTSFQ